MILCSKMLVLAVCLVSVGMPVSASCLGSGDTEIEALAKNIGRQPHQALQAIELALDPDLSLTVERRAWLEAARAQAKRMLGLEKPELPQAIKDAQSLPADHPALLQLQIARLYGADLTESTRQEMDSVKHQIAKLPDNQPSTLCLAVRLASVMADHVELNGEAFQLATRAYRNADTELLAWQRAEAASVLGQIVVRTDSSYGRMLSEEALHYFESQEMHDMAANELYMMAISWLGERDMKSMQNSVQQFLRSIEAGRLAKNSFAVAYAEAGLCDVFQQLGQVQDALTNCVSSLQQFKDVRHITVYSTVVNHAATLLADNRPGDAMEQLSTLLRDWPDWDVGYWGYRFHDTRGRINETLGNTKEAMNDFKTALRELVSHEINRRARSNRLFQSRFRVEQLEQDLELKTQQTEERERRNRILFIAGLIVLALLCVIVVILVRHRRLYRSMAFTDPLTGLANRRYTVARAQEAFEHARARKQHLCIALIDLDRFKSCNDQYGHDAGDEALQQFARVAESVLRPGDLLGRWGGEEFLLVLQGIDQDSAARVLERLRSAAAEVRLTLAPDYPLQFSAGVVELRGENTSVEELVMLADKALYRAKAEGRNRYCFAEALTSVEPF
ncbi:GGDEF domain-containing protein [Rheinheimera muenzenbergensis]|uniref:diguanylate cyclase n=1 Tax=Rheinheimera muenzenbergensis TaxID=1193628 RepID=A0ABU8C369_9GAMM